MNRIDRIRRTLPDALYDTYWRMADAAAADVGTFELTISMTGYDII